MSDPEQSKWRIEPDETYGGAITFTTEVSDIKLRVTTKWDGCTDLWVTEIEDEDEDEEECYHHICDIDAFIAALQSVRDKARSYFHGEFRIATVDDEERLRKIAAFQKEEQ